MRKDNFKFLFSIFCLLVSCGNSIDTDEKISVIEFSSYRLVQQQGKPIEIKNSLNIAFYKDLILYKITYFSLNKVADSALHTSIDLDDRDGIEKHRYYVVKKGESRGLVYLDLNKKKEFNYNEMLKYESLRNEDNGMFAVDLGKPAQIERNKITNDIEIEKFENRFKGEHEPDSVYRYYSKDLVDIDFSFNPSVDKKMNSKFCKFLLVYNSKPRMDGKKPAFARHETYWQFKKIKSKDIELFQKYFDDFIAEREKTDLK